VVIESRADGLESYGYRECQITDTNTIRTPYQHHTDTILTPYRAEYCIASAIFRVSPVSVVVD
jgi:hypothetical protein